MKISTELFRLIKSLSKSEKRYFKLVSSLQSGEKNYIKLFDTIEQQTEYDEDEIKKIFAKETFIKHLPSEKNHLYNLILKSLRGFYADKSSESVLQEQLRNIELLYNKALFPECGKMVRKAKKIAYDYEKYYFLLDLIDWEKNLAEENLPKGNFIKNINLLIEEEEECLEKLRNIAEYQKLYSKVNYVIRSGFYSRSKEEQQLVEKIANHPLIINKNTALSTKAASACYFVKGLCAVNDRDIETALINFRKVEIIMDNNPFIKQELPKRYIFCLKNLFYNYLQNKDWVNCFKYIDKMKELRGHKNFLNTNIQLKLFTFSLNGELLAHIAQGKYDRSIEKIIPKVLEGINEFGGKINKEAEILFYFNISRTYFGYGDVKKALKYINMVLNTPEVGLREDIFTFSRLINLIIHYELGNYDLLDYTIKSTKRYLAKNQRNYNFEITFLNGIRKVIKTNDADKLPIAFKNFKKELSIALKDPYSKAVKDYFGFLIWIDSKIHKKNYGDLVREQALLN